MSETKDFFDKIIKRFDEKITDYVFLMIENDKDLMKKYLDLVSESSLKTVNQQIGRKVKTHYKLENETVESNPESKLIDTYTKHVMPKE